MIRLTDEQWERIRDHFPEEHIAEDCRFRSVRMRRTITKSACLVQLCFDFYMIEAKPENLIGDRAYDSDPLDDELRRDGIEMIAPHRCNRSKPPTSVAFSSAGSSTHRTFLVLYNSPCLLVLFRRF